MIPIWKDTTYTASTDSLSYNIKVDNQVIFSAKAFKYPNSNTLSINVNKICQDYLSTSLPDLRYYSSTSYTHTNALRTFSLYNDSQTKLADYVFVYNWDYDEDMFGGSTEVLSSPINGHATDNMKVFRTTCSNSGVVTRIGDGEDGIDGYTTGYCGDYALIYSNSHGGFDSFLIENNVKITDNFETCEYNRPYDNTSIDFEKKRYLTEITRTMEMTTGILTDEQSINLANNLLPTNYLYVQDLRTNQFYPALIKDTSVEHKIFKNGKRLPYYTITIELSQSRLRK